MKSLSYFHSTLEALNILSVNKYLYSLDAYACMSMEPCTKIQQSDLIRLYSTEA